MARKPAMLEVHVVGKDGQPGHVGSIVRDRDGGTTFDVSELFIRMDPAVRPVVSLSWINPQSDDDTRRRLGDRRDKIALNGSLPSWFQNLLPEGALSELVRTEMGVGDHDMFDVLARLGANLPGGVLVLPPDGQPQGDGFKWEQVMGFRTPVPDGVVKFSLAGVQLKFAGSVHGERLTAPGRSDMSDRILKMPSSHHPDLPETEYSAMKLCAAVGLDISEVDLVPCSKVDGIPEEFLKPGANVLSVHRFDRVPGGGRVHIEDTAQVLGAAPFQKYMKANQETVISLIARFSADRRRDVIEAMRRVVADILLGNGDSHLKNWSMIFPDAVSARLSPAYDIVPTWLYDNDDTLALRLAGTAGMSLIRHAKFRRVAEYLKMDPDAVERELRDFVLKCLDVWPTALRDLPLEPARAKLLVDRMERTALAIEARD